MDGAHFCAGALVVNMDLMAQGEKLRLDFVTGFSCFVKDIETIGPGENTLFDI